MIKLFYILINLNYYFDLIKIMYILNTLPPTIIYDNHLVDPSIMKYLLQIVRINGRNMLSFPLLYTMKQVRGMFH